MSVTSSPSTTPRSAPSPAARERNRLGLFMQTLLRPELLILDEIGYQPLERPDATCLFELVNKRYQLQKSIPLSLSTSAPLLTASPDWQGPIDITIDGADEVDDALDLIKGAGGALLREKLVAQATLREIIVIDETKLSPMLGTYRAVPVEVLGFGKNSQTRFLESLGARVTV